MNTLKAVKWSYILCSAVFCIMGGLLILWPRISITVLCYLIGALFIVSGIIKIVGYCSEDLYKLAFQFDLALGVFAVAIGVIMLLFPKGILSLFHMVIGVIVLTDAVFKLQTAADAKKFGLSKWWIILLNAILSGLLGLLLIVRPFDSATVIMVFIGITLLIDGIQNMWVAAYTVKIVNAADTKHAFAPEDRSDD